MNLYSEPPTLAAIAVELEASDRYRVLRKLDLAAMSYEGPLPLPPGWTKVLVVDTETTDLSATCELIELGLLLVALDPQGRCQGVLSSYNGLQEPSIPISEEASAVHGLTLDDVQGQTLDRAQVDAMRVEADLVVAHNAEFDRPVVERTLPGFREMPWVCSFRDIDWKGSGQRRANLEALSAAAGFFYGAHRALDDCAAVVAVLSHEYEGQPAAWPQVLAAVAQTTYVLWAVHSPFHAKDLLKSRGYRWQAGTDGPFKAWYCAVSEANLDTELAWLHDQVYAREFSIPVDKASAVSRWSGRSEQRTSLRWPKPLH